MAVGAFVVEKGLKVEFSIEQGLGGPRQFQFSSGAGTRHASAMHSAKNYYSVKTNVQGHTNQQKRNERDHQKDNYTSVNEDEEEGRLNQAESSPRIRFKIGDWSIDAPSEGRPIRRQHRQSPKEKIELTTPAAVLLVRSEPPFTQVEFPRIADCAARVTLSTFAGLLV